MVWEADCDRGQPVTGLIGGGVALRRHTSVPDPLGAGREQAGGSGSSDVNSAGRVLRRSTAPVDGASNPIPTNATPTVLRRNGILLGGHRGGPTTEPRRNSMSQGTGAFSGTQTETTDVDQSVNDRAGGFTGSRTETTRKGVVGGWKSGETSREVNNGKSTTSTKTSHDHLAGAEAWLKTITEASDAQLLAAFSARARAGAFSKGSGEVGYQRGQFATGASASYDAMAGVDTGVSGHAKVDTSGLLPALEAAIAAYAKGGVGLDAEASAFARLWKLEFVATGKVLMFAGFEGSAKGRAFLNAKEGIGVEGEAHGFVGARGELSGKTTISLGPAELMAMASVEGKAGAWASASGKVAISFTGVEVTGKAEAFAGVTGTAKGSTAMSFRGKQIFSAKGSITAAAGIGAKVGGSFVLSGGKLKIDLGVLAVKGIGGGFDLSGEVDLYELGNAICTTIWERYANYVNEITEDVGYIPRDVIIDPVEKARVEQQGYDAFIFDFRAYAAEKLSGTGQTGLNRQRVEKILQARRGQLGTALTHVEVDLGIERAAKEAFGPLLKHIAVQGGALRVFDAVLGSGIGAVREQFSKDSSTDALRAALAAGAAQTRGGTDKSGPSYAPDYAAVNKILGKYAPALINSYGQDSAGADAVIAGLIEEVYDGIWTQVVVTGGKLSSAKVDLQAIARKNAQAAEQRETVARVGALAALQSACAAYAAEQAKSARKPITRQKVSAIIEANAGPLLASARSEVADRVITDMVMSGLGKSIKTLIFSGGEIRAFEAADPAEVNREYLADQDAKRRTALYDKAKQDFMAYVLEKTKSGENGVKEARVQKIVDAVTAKIAPEFLGEADAALTIAARDGLGPMVNYVKIENGTAIVVASQTKAKALKDEHVAQEQGRGRFLGEEEANERRYFVRKAVNEPLRALAAEIRADPHGVPTLDAIQRVVDESLGGRSDVLAKADAREYLVQLIVDAFDGVVMISANEQGRLIRPMFDMTRLMQLRDKDSDRAASRAAQVALRGPLKAYAAKTAKGRPTMDGITDAINKARPQLAGLQGEDLDFLLQMAVMEAFTSARIKSVTFSGGEIVALRLAR